MLTCEGFNSRARPNVLAIKCMARQKQLSSYPSASVGAMGAGDAIDDLCMRLAAYAVGAHEMLESARITLAGKLFGIHARDSDKEFIGSANTFSKTTVLITGANQGIGLATAKALYRRGSKVVLACRSLERGREAAAVRLRCSMQLCAAALTQSPVVLSHLEQQRPNSVPRIIIESRTSCGLIMYCHW